MSGKFDSKSITRRTLISSGAKLAASALLATPVLPPRYARGDTKRTLRILQWTHFVPEYDRWFNEDFVRQWGEKHHVKVIVDNVSMPQLKVLVERNVAAQLGHDITQFVGPPCRYEEQVIDHADLFSDIKRQVGKPIHFAERSSYNPITKKRYCIADSFVALPLNYRRDLWNDVGVFPTSWEQILRGGQRIRQKHHIPMGFSFAGDIDAHATLRSLMASFGASEQDRNGQVSLKSRQMADVLRFARDLYQSAMDHNVISWDAASNNRAMLSGECSLTYNAISITRLAETYNLPIVNKLALRPMARGPEGRKGLANVTNAYVIWQYSKNIDLAQQFLLDYMLQFREGFLASKFYNLPCFPDAVPDLSKLVRHDAQTKPHDKYEILDTALDWTVNQGYPGYANAVIDESTSRMVLPKMFQAVVLGDLTIPEAMATAENELREIHNAWRAKGLA